jgi:hypothetical protein
MEQLLNITSVPIKVEVKVTKAQLKLCEDTPSVKVSRDKDGFLLKADPIKVNIDNTAQDSTAASRNFDSFTKSDTDSDDNQFVLSYEAVARFVQDNGQQNGDNLNNKNNDVFAAQKALRSIENILDFLPRNGNDISWNDGKLSVTYAASDTSFDWEAMAAPNFEFIPGSIEFLIKEMPRLDIEYLGEPIYFPLSANPNYEPVVDVRA